MTNTCSLKIWLADLTYTQQTVAADVIPHAVGCIAAYTEKSLSVETPIHIFKYPEIMAKSLSSGERPDVIGFSNYVWNGALAYGFAKAIKKNLPGTVIVFGGPNYPTDAEEQACYLREHPAIDFYIIKEGELAFTRFVQAMIESKGDVEAIKRQQLPSIHCQTKDGTTILPEPGPRINDLTDIPSPYTTGYLDEFFDGSLLPIIQTNRGCPFTCTFCVEGVQYFVKVSRNSKKKIQEEIDYIGQKMHKLRAKGGRNDLFIADSNFGMYKEDLATARALAQARQEYGWPEYINVATGKNQKERVLEASKIIDGALRLSGSVQSLDPVVLKNIKRNNINANELFKLGLQANAVGANTYSEIILSLPGDSLKAHLATLKTVMNAGFSNIYLFQLMLLPGTNIATKASKKKFNMIAKYRVLPRCYGSYEVLGCPFVAAEIEEICVANATLSYDDYLLARRFHLVVTMFYNDGIFGALLKLLRGMNVPLFRWIELLAEAQLPDDLKLLFNSFLKETADELWDNREQLFEFLQKPGVVERYINGELGNNLLFVHKTMGITQHLESLASLARTTLRQCLRETKHNYTEVAAFIDDALTYHCARARNLFHNQDEAPVVTLRYDIDGFLNSPPVASTEDYLLPSPTSYYFLLDDSQHDLIKRYLRIYGSSSVSIGRILSKVHVKKLFRQAVAKEEVIETDTAEDSVEDIHSSGFQE